jgi:hypothetical protein
MINGYDVFDAQIKKQREMTERKYRTWVLSIDELTSKEVTVIEETKQGIHLHSYELNHKWDQYACPQDNNLPCPMCDAGNVAQIALKFTVIDHLLYQGKEQKRVLLAKENLGKQLIGISQQMGGLVGKRLRINRSKKPSAGCGDSVQVVMGQDGRAVITDLNRYRHPPYDANFLKKVDFESEYKPLDFDVLDRIQEKSANASRQQKQNNRQQQVYQPQDQGYHPQQGYAPQQQDQYQGYAPQNSQPQQGYQPPQFAAHNQPPQDQGYQPPNFAPPQDQGYQPQTQSNFNPPPQGSNFNPPQQAPQGGVQLYPNNGNVPVSRKDHLNDIPF